jgi:hypothetical protein
MATKAGRPSCRSFRPRDHRGARLARNRSRRRCGPSAAPPLQNYPGEVRNGLILKLPFQHRARLFPDRVSGAGCLIRAFRQSEEAPRPHPAAVDRANDVEHRYLFRGAGEHDASRGRARLQQPRPLEKVDNLRNGRHRHACLRSQPGEIRSRGATSKRRSGDSFHDLERVLAAARVERRLQELRRRNFPARSPIL